MTFRKDLWAPYLRDAGVPALIVFLAFLTNLSALLLTLLMERSGAAFEANSMLTVGHPEVAFAFTATMIAIASVVVVALTEHEPRIRFLLLMFILAITLADALHDFTLFAFPGFTYVQDVVPPTASAGLMTCAGINLLRRRG